VSPIIDFIANPAAGPGGTEPASAGVPEAAFLAAVDWALAADDV
jgi:hypothetical protein